ncbi:MAG: metal-dependent hydrolase [Saprospiraceae bacterium]|nr:metal-dependent hydrolase [Saprospiraceae bacterium]
MDSITQLTLGAAVGEAVLGRKVGNRAMLWGAIGGTLPDLDVFSHFVSDPMSGLAFHRAITHSFTYAVVTPLLLGWLISRLYDPVMRKFWWRDFGLAGAGLLTLLAVGTLVMPMPAVTALKIALTVGGAMLFFPLIVGLREQIRNRPSTNGNTSWKGWTWLFFWAILTHPLLDACTTYGTQLFQPFASTRVSLNNISVVDPLYTLPFLLFVLAALFMTRNSSRRRIINWVGIGLSSAYMLFTFYNKWRVDQIFEKSLHEHGIAYNRMMAMPTIFNNILWQGVAEGDTAYYRGMYSLLDKQPRVLEFDTIPKGHNLLAGHEGDRAMKIIAWFSDGYYNVLRRKDGALQINDLRFGGISDKLNDESDYVFKFIVEEKESAWDAHESREGPPDMEKAWRELWRRVRGI